MAPLMVYLMVTVISQDTAGFSVLSSLEEEMPGAPRTTWTKLGSHPPLQKKSVFFS